MNLDMSQLLAVADVIGSDGDCIITGHAGTGKTTLIAELCRQLPKAEVLAPTGKAAARLRAIGIPCRTIHSWLRWTGADIRRREPARHEIIIDEASMVDAWLLDSVFRFDPPRVILVGDAAQLPPVGKGQPFHDAISMGSNRVSWLTTCHRASGAIHRAALAIRDGNMPEPMDSGGEKFHIRDSSGPVATQEQMLVWVRSGNYDPEHDAILSCLNGKGDDPAPGTVRALNREVVKIVNPRDPGDGKWKVGDKVMNRQNSGELNWYNGDTGKITGIDGAKNLYIRPDDSSVDIHVTGKDILDKLQHGYAFTVHKSQGSQWRRVFFIVLKDHDIHCGMVNRSLLYTGATRAQSGLCIMGQPSAFEKGLQRVNTKRTVIQRLVSDSTMDDFPL